MSPVTVYVEVPGSFLEETGEFGTLRLLVATYPMLMSISVTPVKSVISSTIIFSALKTIDKMGLFGPVEHYFHMLHVKQMQLLAPL